MNTMADGFLFGLGLMCAVGLSWLIANIVAEADDRFRTWKRYRRLRK